MRLIPQIKQMPTTTSEPRTRRSLILLAPEGEDLEQFQSVVYDRSMYRDVLDGVQRLRGSVYAADGALDRSDLTHDGRHEQAADVRSWHLVTIGENGEPEACGRIRPHAENVRFEDVAVSHSALAQSDRWGVSLKIAVESEIALARARGVRFGEYGGWAVAPHLQCSTEAVRMLISWFALSEMIGGVIGLATATSRHSSAAILQRIGGSRLSLGAKEFPAYYEPAFRSEIELLRFDSSKPNPKFCSRIDQCRSALSNLTVTSAARSAVRLPSSSLVQYRGVPAPGRVSIQ